jgi:hypothetical protein
MAIVIERGESLGRYLGRDIPEYVRCDDGLVGVFSGIAPMDKDGSIPLHPRKSSYGPAIGKIVAGGDHGDPVI